MQNYERYFQVYGSCSELDEFHKFLTTELIDFQFLDSKAFNYQFSYYLISIKHLNYLSLVFASNLQEKETYMPMLEFDLTNWSQIIKCYQYDSNKKD